MPPSARPGILRGTGQQESALRIQHPLYRRLLWNPFLVALPFAYLAYSAYTFGFPIGRTGAAGFVAFWFALSVYDSVTGHRLLDWMYSD
jgi:hypothetical protein